MFDFKKVALSALVVTTVLGSAFAVSQPTYAVGTVPADVQTAVDNTTATVAALSPIALAAVAAALVPFGAGMALSFVHKVMSKA
jgi:hypothetical protein